MLGFPDLDFLKTQSRAAESFLAQVSSAGAAHAPCSRSAAARRPADVRHCSIRVTDALFERHIPVAANDDVV